jgi:hypothetical protein
MASVHSRLSSPSAHFQRVGWQGFTLLVPEDWNLHLHDGDWRGGAILFADLRSTRLEVRWQGATEPRKVVAKTVRGIRRNHPESQVEEISTSAVRITQSNGILLLAAGGTRRYELHWPATADDAPQSGMGVTTQDFLDGLSANEGRASPGAYFWSIYGASGWVPAAARLRKASLLPGATTLSFKNKSGTVALGAFSMADRLLAGRSLREWATTAIALIREHSGGHWNEADDQATFTAPTRRWWRNFRHMLVFRHDRVANRIVWSHHFQPMRDL